METTPTASAATGESEAQQRAAQFQRLFESVRSEIARVIVGQDRVVEAVLSAVVAGGHVLLEGVPGLGKTLLVRTLASALDLKFNRIQFTPDLMPADIIGTNVVVEGPDGSRIFTFQPGPVFAQVILADEINRATPKTQSALLEAMQEHSVTVAGVMHRLEEPFFVLATQNPIEMEGTYPLPEAQMDRFLFKILVPSPTLAELSAIVDRTTGLEEAGASVVMTGGELLAMRRISRSVPVAEHVKEFALRAVLATHPDSEDAPPGIRRLARYGSSPRGAQAIMVSAKVRALLQGRFHVSFDDIEAVALPALRHRVLLNFEGEAEGASTDDLIREVLGRVRESLQPKVAV